MSEISEEQAREALAASDNLRRKLDNGEPTTTDELSDGVGSPHVIFAWVRQELSRRDAERAEREKPIDAEWFRKHGNEVCSIFVCRDDVEYEIEWAAGTPGIGVDLTVYSGPRKCFCHSVNLRHITTRGQLLDLLRALNGGAS